MKISELETSKEGIIQFPLKLHISEVDQLAGKVINFINKEMPLLTTGQAIEVLSVATWWTQLAAYNQFAEQAVNNPGHAGNTYWEQVGSVEGEQPE
jgi:hypothetical protein